jgi:hypothetical protein
MTKQSDKQSAELSNYIEKNKEPLLLLPIENDKDKELINNVYVLVRKFMVDRKLIVFGGTAVDYALRLKGSSLYYDYELPDYDCLSDKSVDDAYDLAEILHRAGFENVKVIRAIHVETMRVRVNLLSVADIGYIPTFYYNQYKYLTYNGVRVLHPDCQRIDQHRSLCFPLNNPPREDIFNRWEKDIKKFNMYEQYYPITESTMKYTNTTVTYKLIDNYKSEKYAFHGFAAFAIYQRELYKHIDLNMPKLDISFKGNECTLTSPINELILVTNEQLKWEYHTILNLIPKSCMVGNVHYYYTELLSITKIDYIQVVTIQYLLLHFLFFYNFGITEHRQIYKNFYVYTLEMIRLSEGLYKDINSPFLPTIEFLGKKPDYNMEVGSNPLLPVNYTPSKEGTRRSFDYSNFKISGEYISK